MSGAGSASRGRPPWSHGRGHRSPLAAGSAFDEIASALPGPVVSVSPRVWAPDFPEDIAVQRRSPYEARAGAIMYRQELAELAHARGWKAHWRPLIRAPGSNMLAPVVAGLSAPVLCGGPP